MSEFLAQWQSSSPYIEAQTSGSTGAPKPIRLLKSDMRASAEATNEFFNISSSSTLATPLSENYIAGKMMAVRASVASCRLLQLPNKSDFSLPEPVDLLAIVPAQIPAVLRQKDKIKNLLIGGAPLSAEQEMAVAESGIKAYLGYGMTETCSHVALRRVGEGDIFTAMPGVEFSLKEDCLQIHSGRYSWQTLTTRDLAQLIDLTHFRWLGRADNVIISGGIKIHPELLEAEIMTFLPELPPFFITSQPSERWGQEVVMVMENAPQGVLEAIKTRLADPRRAPKRVFSVENLPRTANGKIKRQLP